MRKTIVKLTDGDQTWYMEWSRMSEGPITFGMGWEEFKSYYKEEHGNAGMRELEEDMKCLNHHGSNSLHNSAADFIRRNRAGRLDTHLSKEQIIEYYCKIGRKDIPPPDGTTIDWDYY